MMPLVIAIIIFVVAILVAASVMYFINRFAERRKVVERIKDKKSAGKLDAWGWVRTSWYRIAKKTGERFSPKQPDFFSGTEHMLITAGYRRRNAVTVYWGMRIMFAILLPLGFMILKILFIHKSLELPILILVIVVLFAAGYYIPEIWLKIKIKLRKEKIVDGFPDTLDLLLVCVEAGMSLDAAINRVGQEMRVSSKIISDELRLTNLELNAGKSRREALRNFAERTDVEDVSSLVSLLIQTDRFGTSIADALRVHADSMRKERYQRAEERAMKIPVKILLPLMVFIFPVLLIIVMGPPFINAYRLWIASH